MEVRWSMIKILFLWDVFERQKEYFRTEMFGWAEPIFPAEHSEAELCNLAAEADVMIGWNPTEAVLAAAPRLKLFINPGAGVEHQIDRFKKLPQITLVNSHGNAYATAQHGVAMLLALMNRILPHHNWMVEGQWRMGENEAKSVLLRRKTLGLLGYGAVAQWVNRFLAGFELRRIVYKNRPLVETPEGVDEVFSGNGLHEFLRQTDILVVAVPHNAKTENMIGVKELELLGPEGILLQIGRGPVVNEEAFYQALRNGVIESAAIDVWYEYNPEPDAAGRKWPYHYPFHELPNVLLSPHRADSPEDDLFRWADVMENVRRLSEGRSDFLNVVDLGQGY